MEDPVILKIKSQFYKKGNPAKIPLMSGKQFFEARSENDGVYVDNLKNQPFLPWKIFSESVNCIKENGGKVKKGNATNSKLGDQNLGLDTLEGYIASKIYGCKIGETVFKRVNSIASILAWAGICENTRGQISLIPMEKEMQSSENENKIPPAFSAEEGHRIKELGEQIADREEEINRLRTDLEICEKRFLEKELDFRTLQERLTNKIEEAQSLESRLLEKEEEIESLNEGYTDKVENIKILEEKLSAKEMEIKKLEDSFSTKDKDLKILAEEVIKNAGQMKKIEEKLAEKERKINTMGTLIATAEEKVEKLEKQLSAYEGEEKLAAQLREKEEFIKQLKGTLASKEEEFSKVSEENRKYRMQQKLASEGLRQIEEQKASKKWWKRL